MWLIVLVGWVYIRWFVFGWVEFDFLVVRNTKVVNTFSLVLEQE